MFFSGHPPPPPSTADVVCVNVCPLNAAAIVDAFRNVEKKRRALPTPLDDDNDISPAQKGVG